MAQTRVVMDLETMDQAGTVQEDTALDRAALGKILERSLPRNYNLIFLLV